jgi:hypothetical protein
VLVGSDQRLGLGQIKAPLRRRIEPFASNAIVRNAVVWLECAMLNQHAAKLLDSGWLVAREIGRFVRINGEIKQLNSMPVCLELSL